MQTQIKAGALPSDCELKDLVARWARAMLGPTETAAHGHRKYALGLSGWFTLVGVSNVGQLARCAHINDSEANDNHAPPPPATRVSRRADEGEVCMPVQLYIVDEAAQWLNTTPRFIRRLIAERRIAFTRLGRHVRIEAPVLDAFVTAGRVEPVDRIPNPRRR